MSMMSGDQPRRRARMTSRAGGTQDSGAGSKPGALTAMGGTGYTAPIPSPQQMPRTSAQPRMSGELPRNRFPRQDEGPEAQNFARILFGPGALQGRGGSGYQGLDAGNMMNAARAAALQSRLFDAGTPAPPINRRMSDVPNMTQDEIDMYNKPDMDINDAFFGPGNGDRFNVMDWLRGFQMGGR